MTREKIIWRDEYGVGVKVFDVHHKKLFGYIDELHEIIHENMTDVKFEIILEKFIDYADFHLRAEEEMFDKYNFPGKDEHVSAHESYRKKVLSFKGKREGDNKNLAIDFLDFLEDWWVGHVVGMDKKYTEFFNKNGLT